MKVCAVIATRYRPPELEPLLAVLDGDGVCAHVLRDRGDHAVNRMWNRGCDAARKHKADVIAVLNDDIQMMPGTLAFMTRAFAANPRLGVVHPDVAAEWGRLPKALDVQPSTVPWRTGFCIVFRTEVRVRFDESYVFDCGDVQFVEDVRKAGWQVGQVNIRVKHEHAVYGVSPGYSTQRDRARMREISERDLRLWQERHGVVTSHPGWSYR